MMQSNNKVNYQKYGGEIYSKIQSELNNFNFIFSSDLIKI